jgi:hypothetical protein
MSAQDMLIGHGEKIIVAVTVAACGYWLYSTFTNSEIRPKDISMERINEMVGKVEKARGEVAPPVMKAPPNYLDDMLTRWSVELPSRKYMAWLSAATDVGPPDVRGAHYYIYEIHPPTLVAVDAIGTIELSVTLPTSKRTNDPRISDASSKTWTLEQRVDNTAQWLGLVIEQRISAGEWMPITTKDIKNGLVQFKGEPGNLNITVPTTEPWQRYSFRARLIAAVTGLPMEKASSKDVEQSVMVHQGSYAEEIVDWTALGKGITSKDINEQRAVLSKFQTGSTTGPLATQLKPGQALYYSADSDEASTIATSSIRFVFEKINLDFQDPKASGASILLTKFLRDPKAGADKNGGKWLLKPVQFKPKLNEAVGEKNYKVLDPFQPPAPNQPGLFKQEDLSTAFVLTEVKQNVQRILYYEILPKARPNGGRSKDLEMKPKPIDTEVVTLTNMQSGTVLTLPACKKVQKPNKPLSYFYPDFVGMVYDEVEEFKKNPSGFKQRELIPAEPKAYKPDEGPLEDLRKRRNDDLLKTDTTYYELADGRIIYWEHVNNRVVVIVKAGSEAAAEAAAAKAAEDKVAAEAAAAAAAAQKPATPAKP